MNKISHLKKIVLKINSKNEDWGHDTEVTNYIYRSHNTSDDHCQ
jgi:hypothetical protein